MRRIGGCCSVRVGPSGGGKMARVRVLFSFAGGMGHFLPTVVFARSLARRGHEVRYACQEGMVAIVEAAGWPAESTVGASLLDRAARRPLAPVDRAAEERVMAGFFAGKVARARAARVGELIGRWEPDLVVRDEVDFGAALAAEAAGLPHAAVAVIAAGRLTRPEVIELPLGEVRDELGLDPVDAAGTLHRHLLLVPVPGSFRDPTVPLPATARCVRPAILEDFPPVVGPGRTRPAPQVYVTLGTIFPQESGDLFHRVLAGLAPLPVEVTVTIGDAITLAELGDLPATVRVEPFLPLGEILPACDLVVSHGGSGTVVASLAFGVPQLVLAMGADQPDNADRCGTSTSGSRSTRSRQLPPTSRRPPPRFYATPATTTRPSTWPTRPGRFLAATTPLISSKLWPDTSRPPPTTAGTSAERRGSPPQASPYGPASRPVPGARRRSARPPQSKRTLRRAPCRLRARR